MELSAETFVSSCPHYCNLWTLPGDMLETFGNDDDDKPVGEMSLYSLYHRPFRGATRATFRPGNQFSPLN